MKKFVFLLLCHCVSLFAVAQPTFIKDSLDLFVEKEMKQWQLPGAAIAIVKDGKVVVMKGYGIRELGKPEKVDEKPCS
jgi:CubicO group peptidase (beta-lactamase class C family)